MKLPRLAIWAAFTPNDYTVVLLFDNRWSMGQAHCSAVQHVCGNSSFYTRTGSEGSEEQIMHR